MKTICPLSIPRVLSLTGAILLTFPFSSLAEGESEKGGELPQLTEFEVRDLEGKLHKKEDWPKAEAVVLLFLDRECPVANAFAPELSRIADEYADKDVVVYGVYPDPYSTAAETATHGRDYSLSFPLIHDPSQVLAKRTGVTTIPTAVVLKPDGKMLYRGRVNDKWGLDGSRKKKATRNDLRDALDTILRGEVPDPNEVAPYGCLLLSPPSDK